MLADDQWSDILPLSASAFRHQDLDLLLVLRHLLLPGLFDRLSHPDLRYDGAGQQRRPQLLRQQQLDNDRDLVLLVELWDAVLQIIVGHLFAGLNDQILPEF